MIIDPGSSEPSISDCLFFFTESAAEPAQGLEHEKKERKDATRAPICAILLTQPDYEWTGGSEPLHRCPKPTHYCPTTGVWTSAANFSSGKFAGRHRFFLSTYSVFDWHDCFFHERPEVVEWAIRGSSCPIDAGFEHMNI